MTPFADLYAAYRRYLVEQGVEQAATLAHELNQPLTAITNYVEAANALLAEPGQESIAMTREALAECSDHRR